MQSSSHCTYYIFRIWFILCQLCMCVSFCCLYIPGLGLGTQVVGEGLGNENPLRAPAQILASALPPRSDRQAAEKHASEPSLLGKDQ